MRKLALLLSFFVLLSENHALYAQRDFSQTSSSLWQDIPQAAARVTGRRDLVPLKFRTLRADLPSLRNLLLQAPEEFSKESFLISLPDPSGKFVRFRIEFTQTMAPELAAKFPEIQTWRGFGVDDSRSTLRMDITPHGFHAMILSTDGTWFVDPYSQGNTSEYMSYFKRDFVAPASKRIPEMMPVTKDQELLLPSHKTAGIPESAERVSGVVMIGETLRTYSAAIATTGEYTDYHGGTVPLGLAAVTTSLNRINGVYERDFAVRMELVANNNLIIYTDGSSDPYTNGDVFANLSENQVNIDAVIGNANYDIGHILSTGGGGVAYLACVCDAGSKAQGATSGFPPVGDPFDIDYVAHEMGHQFAGNHTWNYCSGGGEFGHTYEPGSASTIMGYAGLCGGDDLQPHSDDMFHVHNIEETVTFTTAVFSGGSCPTVTVTGNTPPVANPGTGAYTLPISTPFKLSGSATDVDGDSLTYCWEQFDLGPMVPIASPSGNCPIFRSWPPSNSPDRILPRLNQLVINTTPWGETLPTYARTLNFRLTVRDNEGGVHWADRSFPVSAAAGPFAVTYPNTATSFAGGELIDVTWNVASTTSAPVSCANVNIRLSRDGGFTYPYLLIAGVPNDGLQPVYLPDITTSQARVLVEAADNIFFDISNFNFIIDSISVGTTPHIPVQQTLTLTPNPASGNVSADISLQAPAACELVLVNALGQVLFTEGMHEQSPAFRREIPLGQLSEGIYFVELRTSAGVTAQKLLVTK